MKLLVLNTWGARVREPFIEFVKKHGEIDIFCFQEIYDKSIEILGEAYPDAHHDLFTELVEILPNHKGIFRPALEGVFGLATFIKKSHLIKDDGEIFIHTRNQDGVFSDGHHDRNLQWLKVEYQNKTFVVINVHGLWNGKGKDDAPEKIAQSRVIRGFMDKIEDPKILCGDFNLNPDTESIKILEEGMRNLVKDYAVPTTRNSLYFNKPSKTEKYADYVFVSPEVEVNEFKVLPDEVSDHAPLFVDFEIK